MTSTYWTHCSPAWYSSLLSPRAKVHDEFLSWCREQGSDNLAPILEVGCGSSLHYARAFGDVPYTGIDVSPTVIADCSISDAYSFHNYECSSIESLDTKHRKWGLVFSHAVIDHVQDIPAFLAACVRATRHDGWIYLTAYRGFHDIPEHIYSMGSDGCWYNDVSPSMLRAQLLSLGVHEFSVAPGQECAAQLGPELVCIARIP